jgi:hypothetical protein
MQNMRVKNNDAAVDVKSMVSTSMLKKERRNASLLSKRIFHVVNDMLLPMIQSGGCDNFTSFTFTEQESVNQVLKDVLIRDCPALMNDRDKFMSVAAEAFDSARKELLEDVKSSGRDMSMVGDEGNLISLV